MKARPILKAEAKQIIKNNPMPIILIVGGALVAADLISVIPIIGGIITIFLAPVVVYIVARASLRSLDGETNISQEFAAGLNGSFYIKSLLKQLGVGLVGGLIVIITITMMFTSTLTENYGAFFIALILLIVGAIFTVWLEYSWSFIPYIAYRNPELPIGATFSKSMKMLKGYKIDLFVLHLSFIGWVLLFTLISAIATVFLSLVGTIITTVASVLYLAPYMAITKAGFYLEVAKEHDGTIS